MQRRNTAYNRLRKTNNGTFRAYSDTTSRTIGLRYEQKGSRKAAVLHVLLPFITRNGNTVPTDVRLTGAQARRLYEFLSAHYSQTQATANASAVVETPATMTATNRKRNRSTVRNRKRTSNA